MSEIYICPDHRAEWDAVRQGYYCQHCFHHFTDHDVPALQRQLAELQKKLERARTYHGIEGWPCPLCRYENGRLLAQCYFHEQIESLTLQLHEKEQQLAERDRELVAVTVQRDLNHEQWKLREADIASLQAELKEVQLRVIWFKDCAKHSDKIRELEEAVESLHDQLSDEMTIVEQRGKKLTEFEEALCSLRDIGRKLGFAAIMHFFEQHPGLLAPSKAPSEQEKS